jgi:hypothetical protein
MTVIARLDVVARSYAGGVKALGPLDLEIREGEFLYASFSLCSAHRVAANRRRCV